MIESYFFKNESNKLIYLLKFLKIKILSLKENCPLLFIHMALYLDIKVMKDFLA